MSTKKHKRKTERKYIERFTIAGFSYYEGCVAMKNLEIGTKLHLKAEPTNKHDRHAVEIYYKNIKLGYIPRNQNRSISKILQFGLPIFEARVQELTPNTHTENQVGVIVYLVK